MFHSSLPKRTSTFSQGIEEPKDNWKIALANLASPFVVAMISAESNCHGLFLPHHAGKRLTDISGDLPSLPVLAIWHETELAICKQALKFQQSTTQICVPVPDRDPLLEYFGFLGISYQQMWGDSLIFKVQSVNIFVLWISCCFFFNLKSNRFNSLSNGAILSKHLESLP